MKNEESFALDFFVDLWSTISLSDCDSYADEVKLLDFMLSWHLKDKEKYNFEVTVSLNRSGNE